MSHVNRGKGLFALVLIAVLIIGVVSFVMIYGGPALCFGCPTTIQYNPSGSTHTLKTNSLTTAGTSTTVLTGGSPSWPIGSAAAGFTINGPLGPFGSWVVALPADSSQGVASSYVFSSSYSGTAFLNSQNNAALWNAESASLGGSNPVVYNSTFTSNQGAPTACNTASTYNVCKVTWYLNRYYFTVDMKTGGAGLYVACASTCQGYSSFFGFGSNKAQYDAAFQSGFQTVFSTINQAAHLSTGTSLSLQLNLPPLPGGQSNLDVAGVLAAWTAPPCTNGGATPSAGGSGSNDICVSGCTPPAGCNIVQSGVHTPLTLFSDAALTQRYLPNCLTSLNAPNYSAAQLAGACSASLSGTVYTKIDISDFGAGFSQGANYSNCGISSFSSCWTVTAPEMVLTVMLDVLTSNHVFQQYATPAPQTGTSAGGFDGQVVDGSLFWKPGVAGANVCLVDISGCYNVNGAGYFNATNVPGGNHQVQITAPGFTASVPISVSVSTGSVTHVGQISLSELNPWYTGNLCIQGTQGAFGLSAGICIPWLGIFTVAGVVVLLAAIYSYFSTAPARTAAKVADRLTSRNSPSAQGFIARRIAQEIRAGVKPKQAQAIAFNEARQRGYHVPPPPRK